MALTRVGQAAAAGPPRRTTSLQRGLRLEPHVPFKPDAWLSVPAQLGISFQ